MPMITYKPLHTEKTLNATNSSNFSFASNVSGSPLVRVLNTGVANTLHLYYANGVEYANLTVLPSTEVIIKKQQTDLIQGNNMLAIDVAYQY